MVPLRRHAAKSEGQSESRRSMLGMLPIELERVLCFGPRKLTMVWGPKGVASTVTQLAGPVKIAKFEKT